MFEIAEDAAVASLTDRIDEISTRLILDGVKSIAASDFEGLSRDAAQHGFPRMADVALALAESIAGRASYSVPERTRLLSSGLVELKKLVDEPASGGGKAASAAGSAPVKASVVPAPVEMSSLAADEGLILEFITEASEHLVTIESQMLVLEKDNTKTETLNAVFRGFHTIKGLAGFLEFAAIQALAHEVETLLDLARTGKIAVTPLVVDVVLESTDVVRNELAGIQQRLAGKVPEPTNVDEALLQRIRDAARGEASEIPIPMPEPEVVAVVAKAEPARPASGRAMKPAAATAAAPKPVAERVETSLAAQPVAPKAVVAESTRPEPARTETARAEPAKAADNASVRIDTGKLDQLMDMVGEMVIAQTLIGHSPALVTVKDARLMKDLTQLARITADVQRITTGMRMVPIGTQFQKTARVIRDLSRRAGKQIVLETTGEDTELDKTIAEELSDPLLHMVRNSIDHGIETPEERAAAGKEPTAHIRIAAYHQSGQIVVAISDDGRGLNREKILAKALQNGLIQPGAQLTDNEIFLLIFEAGFSTAEKVTDISGRGVGMDVVRRHVQKLRGRIEIQSKAGEGTTFYIKLPLTLAIIEGLVVVVGGQRFIVPIFSVKEMFRPSADMLSTVHGTSEMVMVRDGLMPIVRLHRRFTIEPRTDKLTEGTLIVCESGGHMFCLLVDDLIGKQEVVIKSLGQSFKDVIGVAGCAILGDGRVGLILDIDGIYKGRS
jgi:two-component system chemotaxis sensor kinase CheA